MDAGKRAAGRQEGVRVTEPLVLLVGVVMLWMVWSNRRDNQARLGEPGEGLAG